MGCQLRGRQSEDRPAVAGIDGRKLEHVSEERPIPLWVRSKDHCMHSGDHVRLTVDGTPTPVHPARWPVYVVAEHLPFAKWAGRIPPSASAAWPTATVWDNNGVDQASLSVVGESLWPRL